MENANGAMSNRRLASLIHMEPTRWMRRWQGMKARKNPALASLFGHVHAIQISGHSGDPKDDSKSDVEALPGLGIVALTLA